MDLFHNSNGLLVGQLAIHKPEVYLSFNFSFGNRIIDQTENKLNSQGSVGGTFVLQWHLFHMHA
jgi:hypothetical protein